VVTTQGESLDGGQAGATAVASDPGPTGAPGPEPLLSASTDPAQERAGRTLLFTQLRHQWRGLALGMALGMVWTAGKITIPKLVARAIDRGIQGGDSSSIRANAILVLCVGLVSAVCAGARRWNAFREARLAEAQLRDRVFAHLQGLHAGFHDRVHTGDLMSRANTDLQSVQQLFAMLPMTAANVMTISGATVILLVTDPVLAVLALVSLPFVSILGRIFAKRLHPEVLGIQQESAQLATVVEEAVSGVRVVKGFGAEPVLAARLLEEADDVYEVSLRASGVRARYSPALELLPNLGLVTVLFVGGHQVLDGRLSVGDLVAFNVYLALLIAPLRLMGNLVANYQRAIASCGRVAEVLGTEPAVVDRHGAGALPPGGGALRFEGVTFGYHAGDPVLRHLDLAIEAGTSVALVGGTGSGKTTLARLVPRFYDLQGGRILLDGVDVTQVRLLELRRSIATVFEETFLFSDTIAANIAFADPGATQVAVERAARQAGAHEFIAALPEGYLTEVGERGFSLSGGQRQRIAIARAVLADPRILILDDATSAVDPTKEHEIRDSLGAVMQDRTTIVIAHRPATIALADRVVLLDGGRIVADGTHESLLASSAPYRDVLASAARAETGGADAGGEG
jgi:ATP-binding cassette subfamily B protein